MTTITINERTKAGKIVLELAKMLSVTNKGVRIDSGLNKTTVTAIEGEKDTYNPEFVKMILKSAKSKKRTLINPDDVWGSLGLK
jgi:DICT domain-containing protein